MNLFNYVKRKFNITPILATGGVDTTTYRPKELLINHKKPVTILTYGRLSRKRKGTELVVKACERVFKNGYPIRLVLFDSPTDEAAKKQILEFSCNLPYEFVIDHPVRDNLSMYHRADIFVSAEKRAGWSNTSAEAMASGIPVIATHSGTRDFLIHNETGLVVWRHPYFIRKAIIRLIRDRDLYLKLALNGREKIEQFSWNRLAMAIIGYVNKSI